MFGHTHGEGDRLSVSASHGDSGYIPEITFSRLLLSSSLARNVPHMKKSRILPEVCSNAILSVVPGAVPFGGFVREKQQQEPFKLLSKIGFVAHNLFGKTLCGQNEYFRGMKKKVKFIVLFSTQESYLIHCLSQDQIRRSHCPRISRIELPPDDLLDPISLTALKW